MIAEYIFKPTLATSLVAAAVSLAAPSAHAGPFVGAIPPYALLPTTGVPSGPERHPGKEFSDELDKDADGITLNPQQNVRFDGLGGVVNTFDYNGPGSTGSQVDALAHPIDYLFTNVVTNTTALLFSTRVGANVQGAGHDAGAPTRGCTAGDPICYETVPGAIGTWATWAQVSQHGGQNLDGLEVFGDDFSDDAFRYSLFGDLAEVAGAARCSVWDYDPGTGVSTCVVTQAAVAAAVKSLVPGITEADVDIDALMLSGEEVLFSLWPIVGLPVGDNAFVWNMGTGAIAYLDHGGHLWVDGWLGLNVDALESAAAPEPGSLALLALGLAGLAGLRRRR